MRKSKYSYFSRCKLKIRLRLKFINFQAIQNPEVGYFDGKRCGARCLLAGNGLRRPGLRNSEGRCLDEVDLTILGCKRAETNDKGEFL